MHTVGLANAAAGAAEDEEDLEEGPAYNMRMAKSMTAKVRKRSTAGPGQAGGPTELGGGAENGQECAEELTPATQQLSLKAKSQSFSNKHQVSCGVT